MKKPLLLAAFAVALSSTTVANANNYNIRNSNGAGCSQSEKSGNTFEIGTSYNSGNDSATVSATWKFDLGKASARTIDCNRLYNISVAREQLELDRARLEVELLKAQIKAAKEGKEPVPDVTNEW